MYSLFQINIWNSNLEGMLSSNTLRKRIVREHWTYLIVYTSSSACFRFTSMCRSSVYGDTWFCHPHISMIRKHYKSLEFLGFKLDLSTVSKSKTEPRKLSFKSIRNHHHTGFSLVCFTHQTVNKIVTNYIDPSSIRRVLIFFIYIFFISRKITVKLQCICIFKSLFTHSGVSVKFVQLWIFNSFLKCKN